MNGQLTADGGVTVGAAVAFGLLLVRSTSIFLVAPIIGAKAVPARVRLTLALLVTAASYAFLDPTFAIDVDSTRALLEALLTEIAFGLVVGVSARVFIDAAHAAGQTLGLAAGLGFGATLDPIHGAPSSAVGELTSMLALGLAVGLGLHRELIAWYCASVEHVPPGAGAVDVWTFAEAAITTSIDSIALAVRLAFPVMAATTSVHVVVGLVGRAVPQMSLSNVGFAVPLLAGGWALSTCANDIATVAARAAIDALRALG